ncbi:MAG: hypothetical protein COZ49_01290 [Candidatus Yonathbacteria bacterium CG_4_10_14_3_um_filter_47_65]|uniref:Uncharacterized protein n=2 Tax=Parcubacteria group TaxID=1794811 RepID=A0A2M8D9H1_9BACT|nr:MAG: hypothetical protein AUJ44_02840 [Candidatus Nomurabacteria bacterium CG1_02_47_685]PIP03984.1 MAG: hypothetical protein COX54_01675 [Candidatus Yonathbacteria bacterium CG23_combo_of_CG06-09_8_20_14_all_46_18]PIQ33210.1 MAG: hypothetical protein COW61_00105 [Candidatus Yonathbacteria bacterium CG17_big_fil_post_rev_8_21_14_2_50_46_19]PIX56598.1 MAG: hypothetical protein COZ49_01290 [Candidatus Yonathbacteria bacterium CG_4_10_14_3_um_filter_47_65]PIY57404.1 MAG: hypothetical protein CO
MSILGEIKINKNIQAYLALGIVVVGVLGWLFGFFDFIPKLSTPFGDFVKTENTAAVSVISTATSTINIANIIDRVQTSKTSKEAEDLLDLYKDTPVVGSGKYSNEWKTSETEGPRLGITISNRTVQCNFEPEWKKKLRLYRLGDQISFSGTFRFIEFRGFYYVDGCSVIEN